jgi:hypothetical protein
MNSRKMMGHPKRRGEWAELQFMAKAAKLGLRISKPWGECRYDVIVESGGHFIRIQVKSTICRRRNGFYACSVKPSPTSRPYRRGEFDFVAAYLIREDIWYIFPAKVVVNGGRGTIILSSSSGASKHAPYKEAWHLLRPRPCQDDQIPPKWRKS